MCWIVVLLKWRLGRNTVNNVYKDREAKMRLAEPPLKDESSLATSYFSLSTQKGIKRQIQVRQSGG